MVIVKLGVVGIVAVLETAWVIGKSAVKLALWIALSILMLVLLFTANVKTAGEIWEVMKRLTRKHGVQVIGHKTKEWSDEHESGAKKGQSGVDMEIVSHRPAFEDMRDDANENEGVWFAGMNFIPLGTTRKFIYKFFATNLDPVRYARIKDARKKRGLAS